MKKLHLVLGSAVALFTIPMVAQAITITNVTTNTILFQDTFEGVSPVSNAAAPDASGDYDPVGNYLLEEVSDDLVQVTEFNDGTGAGPGAFHGSNYLRLTSGGNESQAQLNSTPSIGDQINIQFMAYFPAFPATANLAVFKIRDGGLGDDSQRAGARATPGGVVADLNGDNTALSYQTGVWQKWEFDYTIGASTYTMAVDGVSSGAISNLSRGGPGNLQGLGFWQGTSDAIPYFIDSIPVAEIPEPSSFALLAFGMASLVCRARKRNRK